MTNLEKATFAGGCFWGVEHLFRQNFSDIQTRVGYTGGTTPNPTYNEVLENNTGHVQACQIEFDPTITKYETLVEFFYKIHDPTKLNRQGHDVGPQYRSVIFYHSPEQKETALNVTKKVQQRITNTLGLYSACTIVTEIVEAAEWHDAEPHHQNYKEKNPSSYSCITHYVRW